MNRDTRRILLVAVLAALAGGLASLWLRGPGPLWSSKPGQRALQSVLSATAKAPQGVEVVARGAAVPEFALRDVDGRDIKVPGAWAGRPLLINWWASWCRPCLEEMPELERYSSEQGANGVQVVGIALDDVDAAKAMARRLGITYPLLVEQAGPADSSVRLGNPAGVLPYSVLLDASGKLRKHRIGPFAGGEVAGWVARGLHD